MCSSDLTVARTEAVQQPRCSDGVNAALVNGRRAAWSFAAELVPAEHEVDIYDECFSTVSVSEHIAPRGYDLVGVTSYTSGATRAYEIAADCRKLGIQTIIGGPHASASRHRRADCSSSADGG